jgi:mono/diheme cytochrome c family protein
LAALVEMVYAETGAVDVDAALAEKGRGLFDNGECSDCHEREDSASGEGPNLAGRGSVDWMVSFVGDSGQPQHFGERDEMTRFADTLSPNQRHQLAELLVWLRTASAEQAAEFGL